jgi:hypothetical protein
MLNDVMPDWIGITPAAIASPVDKGSDPSDIAWLIRTVRKLVPSVKVNLLTGKGTATLFWEGKQLKYNEFPSPAPASIRPQMSAMRNVITGRPQNGDSWAFGIDVEANEVEDE